MRRRLALFALGLGLLVPPSAHADHARRQYMLAIGYNGLPADPDPRLREVRYADDDAAAFAQLAIDLGARASVLSRFDADTAAVSAVQFATE